MKSRSVFLVAFIWWAIGAAVVGVVYVLALSGSDSVFNSGSSIGLDRALWIALAVGAAQGIVYGVLPALANAGISKALAHRPTGAFALSRLFVVAWTGIVVWQLTDAFESLAERIMIGGLVVGAAWIVAGIVFDRYRHMLAPQADDDLEPDIRFTPTHMFTTDPRSDDVSAFVRDSLRRRGNGNALFTLESSRGKRAATQVLVDSGGTGHALNLGDESDLAANAAELPGFTLSDDNSIAIAPLGLSASAVVAEGIALIQKVSGDTDVKLQFEGFGH